MAGATAESPVAEPPISYKSLAARQSQSHLGPIDRKEHKACKLDPW